VARPDLYISADIEADGPIPGRYSMLSFGLAVAGSYDGTTFEPQDPEAHTFYRELRPISDEFDPKALEVSGLDRDALIREGRDPESTMRAARAWVKKAAGDKRAVMVAYPVAFDWTFLYWYFIHFSGESPFGHSSALDIQTLYQAGAKTVQDTAYKEQMPEFLQPNRPHTHNALDDAIEQAELFANIFQWVLDGAPAEGVSG
jgi:3'-5' exoribonuclease-like protein